MGLFDREQKRDPYIARLENEIEYLRKQVEKLQECLYAQTSPEAYKHLKQDEQDLKTKSISSEERKKMEWDRSFYSRLAEEQERPLFESVEDLEALLARGTRTNITTPAPLEPGNPEG